MEANDRVTLDLDPSLKRRLKTAAALKGVSISQYCWAAVVRELAKDEGNGVGKLPASRTSFARLEARRDEILGDRVFSGDSTEFIREADDRRDFDREAFERLVKLRQDIFKGKPLPGNSVDLLREAREIREKEMDGWA